MLVIIHRKINETSLIFNLKMWLEFSFGLWIQWCFVFLIIKLLSHVANCAALWMKWQKHLFNASLVYCQILVNCTYQMFILCVLCLCRKLKTLLLSLLKCLHNYYWTCLFTETHLHTIQPDVFWQLQFLWLFVTIF